MAAPVQFVITPFLPREQPALGVSTLVSILAARGIDASVDYLNLELLREIPPALYDAVANFPSGALLGEVLFSRALWGNAAVPWADYLVRLEEQRLYQRRRSATTLRAFRSHEQEAAFMRELWPRLEHLYQESPRLIAAWADTILDRNPRIVGFSSTFHQNVASLALARELRRRTAPDQLTLLFGGANCEGEMGRGLAESFPFIDHVVSGEADLVIGELVAGILERESAGPVRDSAGEMGTPHEMPETASDATSDGTRQASPRTPLPRVVPGRVVQQMDALPVPEFRDYFAAHARLGQRWPVSLAAETSRGCWWGVRSHCKFCGLNGSTMAFRSKSPERAITELKALRDRHGSSRFMMADNIIDWGYLSTVVPLLEGEKLQLFYEVKSNLKRSQLRAMRAAGIDWIQPGIESLSTPVLRLMGKGVTRLANLQVLRWCRELRIKVSWNILYGFPGEAPADYAEMARVAEALFHLPPPGVAIPFRLDRFSPYFVRAKEEGLEAVRPFWAYAYAYPGLDEAARHRLAYYFEFGYQDGREPHSYVQDLLPVVVRWGEAWHRGARLTLVTMEDGQAVFDTRYGNEPRLSRLSSLEVRLLGLLDQARDVEKLTGEAIEAGVGDEEAITAAMARFREERWIVEDGPRALCVVTDINAGAEDVEAA